MEFSVGSRLRAVREARGLSQRALAIRSGVTNGTISMAEQDSTSPSIASLKKILDGIPMSLSDFFAEDETSLTKVFFRSDELTDVSLDAKRGTDALISLRQVGAASSYGIQMRRERYRPGADTGDQANNSAGQMVGLVIEGAIDVTVEGERTALGPGDAYLFDSRAPHRFRNSGAVDCVIVSACTQFAF